MLDSRPKGRGFEPHRRHCVVSLSKNINPSLVLVQPRKTRPFITERLLMGRKESNKTKQTKNHKGRRAELIVKYNVGLNALLQQGILKPVFLWRFGLSLESLLFMISLKRPRIPYEKVRKAHKRAKRSGLSFRATSPVLIMQLNHDMHPFGY